MITLCEMDAAFRRLKEYDPDLDIRLLSKDSTTMDEDEKTTFHIQTRVIRMALVARIADIVKQASTERASLDAAVAMVVVLISTCGGPGEYPGRGHKHAMQAIQLLASVYSRLDETIDLFFDLVERFCAQSRSHGATHANIDISTDTFAARTIQNYDQTLLKLISKHWDASGPTGSWDILRPLDRIKDLRDVYEWSDGSRTSIFARFRRKNASTLFSESYKILRKVQKKRVSERVSSTCDSRVWTPSAVKPRRSTPSMYFDTSSYDSSSTDARQSSDISTSEHITSMPKWTPNDLTEIARFDDKIEAKMRTDSPMDPMPNVKFLYTITEKSEYSSVADIPSPPEFAAFDFDIDQLVPLRLNDPT